MEAGNVFWDGYDDYTMRSLSIEILVSNYSTADAYDATFIGSVSTNSVTRETVMPLQIGDLPGGATASRVIKYSVPQGVSRFLLLIYSSAEDGCGNVLQYPAPYEEANPNATTAGVATAAAASDTSIDVAMPYSGDDNQNNFYIVQYKRTADSTWTDWGENPKGHSGNPYTDRITGLVPGETYDVRLTYVDPEGVFGENSQVITDIVMPVFAPGAPAIGAATALSTTSIRWGFSDGSSNETGFKLHNSSHTTVASSATPDLNYLDETGLVANTQYTRHVHAYNSAGDSAGSAAASRYTLPANPDVTANKSASTWYTTPAVTFTNAAGFGSGGVAYYRYAFNQNPTHSFTGGEAQWTSGTLTGTAASAGSWYLHVKSYNAEGVANGTADYGPYYFDGAAPVVTAFAATNPATSLAIPITAFAASDDIGVSGYRITTSPTPPAAGSGGWTGAAPTAFTVAGDGTYTLYPWAKDQAGRVSAVSASPVTVVVDTAAPAVTSTAPANGATGVSMNSGVTINFSEPVDCSTIDTNSVSISGGGLSRTSCSGTQARFATSSQTRSTGYTVTVSTAVKDLNGNPLQSVYQFSYTTVAVPMTHTVCSSGCDFNTIQSAIDNPGTLDGDTIIVSDGTYSENISFSGKDITLRSVNGAEWTKIQGSGANTAVVAFSNGETSAAVLDGFTIDNQSSTSSSTRGIYILQASPTIRNSAVAGNAVSANKDGGGIYIFGSTSDVTISDTAVTGNAAGARGGGIFADGGADLTFIGGSIASNRAETSGGGIAIAGTGTSLDIAGTKIKGNSAGQYGGGLYLAAGATVTNCTIAGNITTGSLDGGGIFSSATLNLMNSTIAGNYSARNGGGIRHEAGTATITNAIIWDNYAAGTGANISGSPVINYSDVEGGYTGTGNINLYPWFYWSDPASAGVPKTSGDYHIQLHSPVIDQGTTAGAPSVDIDGEARPIGLGIDMGSDERFHFVIELPQV